MPERAFGLTEYFLDRGLPIPAGITAAFVVVLTPLAVYGLQAALGWWAEGLAYREYHTHIDWRWLLMELATLACGAVMLWRYRLPFLVMPIAITLWYMSMDLTPFLFGPGRPDVGAAEIRVVVVWPAHRAAGFLGRHSHPARGRLRVLALPGGCRRVLGRLVDDEIRQRGEQVHLPVHQPRDDRRGGRAVAQSVRRSSAGWERRGTLATWPTMCSRTA